MCPILFSKYLTQFPTLEFLITNGRHFLLINFKIQSLTVHLLLHKDFKYGWKSESLASIFSIWEVFSLPLSTTLNKNFQISNQKGLLLKLFFYFIFENHFRFELIKSSVYDMIQFKLSSQRFWEGNLNCSEKVWNPMCY